MPNDACPAVREVLNRVGDKWSVQVIYELILLGRTLLDPVQALAAWAERHRLEIQHARERHDRQKARPTRTERSG